MRELRRVPAALLCSALLLAPASARADDSAESVKEVYDHGVELFKKNDYMGAMAEFIGVESSFFAVGAIVTILMGALVLHVLRSPELTASNRLPREEEALKE